MLRGRKRKLGSGQVFKMVEMHEKGMSFSAIADVFDISSSSAHRYIAPGSRERCAIANLAWNNNNRERMLAQKAEYRKENPEKMAAMRKAWRDANPEKVAAYLARRKIEIAAYHKAYRAIHREKKAAQRKAYRLNNKAKIAAIDKAWREANSALRGAARARRRALLAGAAVGCLEEIKEIYRQAREDRDICCYLCGKLVELGNRHVDHKMPLSKGGLHTAYNLGITCAHCNMSKGSKTIEEWRHTRRLAGVV